MRYLYLLFFIFLSLHSSFAFSQDGTSEAVCPGGNVISSRICSTSAGTVCKSNAFISEVPNKACTNGTFGYCWSNCGCRDGKTLQGGFCKCPVGTQWHLLPGYGSSAGVCQPISCPEGQSPSLSEGPNGFTSVCQDNPDDGGDDECEPPQVSYAGLCRDAEDSPPDCGDTYTTAVFVDGRYVCSNDESCGDGSTPTIYTNEQGSWKVCGSGDDGNSSEPSGGSSSPTTSTPNTASSAPSTGGGDDGGTGTGSRGGSGSGDGSGNGSGSAASSSSPSGGSGSASSGIGNGGEADASKCENGEPYCDGDPIQCAILVQLWINNCAGYDDVETNNPEDDNEAIQNNFDALISSAEPSVNAEGVLDAMTPGGGNGNGSGSGSGSGTGSGGGNGDGLDLSGLGDAAGSGSGGSCPPDRSIRLGLGTFNVSYQFLCDFAAQISSLVILIFSYIGSIIVYRSLNW